MVKQFRFTELGETSRWQVLQYNMRKRKSITLKSGKTISRLRDGHIVYCNNPKKMQTKEYVFIDGKFKCLFPGPKYRGAIADS